MLEFLLCSMVTILPDYLYRRYVQGKRFGREITLYSVWFALRWGITTCVILTISLITVICYTPRHHACRHNGLHRLASPCSAGYRERAVWVFACLGFDRASLLTETLAASNRSI